MEGSDADPYHFNEDPDPDPNFHFAADPDPDPAPQLIDFNQRPLVYCTDPPRLHFEPPRLHC